MKRLLAFSSLILGVSLLVSPAVGQISITSAPFTYEQNFDSLLNSGTNNTWTDNSTLTGWYSNRTVYLGNHGSLNTGGLYSYGPDAGSDRALGALSSGTATPVFGAVFQNSSGQVLNLADIRLSFVGEQWRQTANAQDLAFSYLVSSVAVTDITAGSWTANAALSFTAPNTGTAGPLDGNLPANQVAFSSISIAASGSLGVGEYLGVRWSKTGTTSPGIAIDNVVLTAVPEPGFYAALLAFFTAAVVLGRRRRGLR